MNVRTQLYSNKWFSTLSINMKTQAGHVWQSVALIASNAAALLPAYQALRQKVKALRLLFLKWIGSVMKLLGSKDFLGKYHKSLLR